MTMRCALCFTLASLILSGCLSDDVCDRGFLEKGGVCFRNASTTDAAASDTDAGEEADAASSGADRYAHFGDTCTTDDQCQAPAPTCLGVLMYCSLIQCNAGDALCPPSYTCTDISMASPDPSVTHVCLKP